LFSARGDSDPLPGHTRPGRGGTVAPWPVAVQEGGLMLRLLAAAMIVLSASSLGFAMAETFRRRPQQLRQLQFALTVLSGEIRFRQTPLPQALAAVAKATPMPVGQLFAD